MALSNQRTITNQQGAALVAVLLLSTGVTFVLLGSLQHALEQRTRVAIDLQIARMERLVRTEVLRSELVLRDLERGAAIQPSAGIQVERRFQSIDCPPMTDIEPERMHCTHVDIQVRMPRQRFQRSFSGRWRRYDADIDTKESGWY
ncbi:hypothetical protein [Aliidiomarina sanyensis]|uniref:Uncharacterized protein n=1 Tax=Aliidiomarina sanyensis TaxID=1249555 RepID=A0A432WG78_9GAMM|nr:hypothetical protein [Aliidiomarina sanyensis]RUO32812.1 hypothetical protein CWE11_07190 [Aliidiomarina sanyensis]